MIRHIVSWKLKATDEDARARAAEEIATALHGLPTHIPEIVDLRVSRNVVSNDRNHDLALVAHFHSVEHLESYLVHPEHLKAAGVIGARVSARACVDLEL